MSARNRVENTTRRVNDNPLAALVEYGFGNGAIEASERRGQQQLLASEVLPTNTDNSDAAFLALGFTFGEPVEGDTIFRAATLPTGWKREGSDHAMWSYIADERGLRRVGIFYKAAFYDRSAHMHLINVGNAISSDALYGDEPITADSLKLAIITDAERAELTRSLDHMRKDIAEFPTIYGKYADRLAAVDALLAP